MESGNYSVSITVPVEDTIISVMQKMEDKEDSDLETVIVRKTKGEKPVVNPVDNDDSSITGRGLSRKYNNSKNRRRPENIGQQ